MVTFRTTGTPANIALSPIADQPNDGWWHDIDHACQCALAGGDAFVVVFNADGIRLAEDQFSDREWRQAHRLRRGSDRLCYLAGRLAIRRIAARSAHAYEIHTMAGGKPFLQDGPAFNLSHSNGVCALVVARQSPVGVDIEHHDRASMATSLLAIYGHPRERDFLANKSELARKHFSLVCWTRKEALLKAAGGGIIDALRSWDTQLGERFPAFAMFDGMVLWDLDLARFGCQASFALPAGVGALRLWQSIGRDSFEVVTRSRCYGRAI